MAQGFQWDYDDKPYSLSGLTAEVCKVFGGKLGTGAFQGPSHWAIEGDKVSLAERAQALLTDKSGNPVGPANGD